IMLLTGLAPAHEQNTNAGHTNTEQTNANANTNTNANTNSRRPNRHSNTNSNMNADTSGDVDVSGNTNAKMTAGLAASDRKFVMADGMGGMIDVEMGSTDTSNSTRPR